MKACNVQKFPFPNFINGTVEKGEDMSETKIKDEYTGRDLEIASGILTKKEAVVRQNEYTKIRSMRSKKNILKKAGVNMKNRIKRY